MTKPESAAPKRLPPHRWRLWVALSIAAIASVAGCVLWNQSSSEKFARQLAQSPPSQSQPADPDAKTRSMVVGTWHDEYQGKRTMTLKDDGTGTMVVELTGWRALMSAPKLTFNMKWSAKDGRLKKQTLSGEPKAQVNMILKTMGDHVDEPILELTEDHLTLLDGDGKTKYFWKRVRAGT